MKLAILIGLTLIGAAMPGLCLADDLTKIIQQDLVTLGYNPGSTDGEATVETIIAVSKFRAEHALGAIGEITPQLGG